MPEPLELQSLHDLLGDLGAAGGVAAMVRAVRGARPWFPESHARVAFLETRPDWICEVLSPSTEQTDRVLKLPIYAREGVGHAWLVNPLLRTLEILRPDGGRWTLIGAHAGEQEIRAEPFDAIVLELAVLWADVAL